ncbi:MAG: helix-turn-helix transcriptional regulator, partial [Eggerthellales bacterium]|nr:helix-turn-helix transcriptional regulator [Eggerthellales bacterium]
MTFSEALTAARKKQGLTQEQLASMVYVTRQAVSRWETCESVP